jgi:tight adherence protein C
MQADLILLLDFAAGFLAVLGTVLAFSRSGRLVRRLRQIASNQSGARRHASTASVWQQRVARVSERLARLATPQSASEVGTLRRRLMNAGIYSSDALPRFFAAKAALSLLLPLAATGLTGALGVAPPGWQGLALLLALAALGYLLPSLVISNMAARRHRSLFESFPDALDLMIVGVESGLGLDAAISRAGTEMRLRSPALAEELALVSMELRVGAMREQALRNFALRSGVEEIGGFVTLVTQAERFGTSVADALRVQADALRTRRQLLAEERAAKVPLKLLFPLIFFVFPSLFTVLLGPSVIRIWRIMLPAMQSIS